MRAKKKSFFHQFRKFGLRSIFSYQNNARRINFIDLTHQKIFQTLFDFFDKNILFIEKDIKLRKEYLSHFKQNFFKE